MVRADFGHVARRCLRKGKGGEAGAAGLRSKPDAPDFPLALRRHPVDRRRVQAEILAMILRDGELNVGAAADLDLHGHAQLASCRKQGEGRENQEGPAHRV